MVRYYEYNINLTLLQVCMYGSVQAAFQHGIMAPLRGPRRDPPPQLVQPQPQPQLQPQPLLRIEERDPFGGGDAPPQQHALRHRADEGRLNRNQVHQRRPDRPREEPVHLKVETLRTADPQCSEDEIDAERAEVVPEARNLAQQRDSENQQEPREPPQAEKDSSVDANQAKSEPKPAESDSSQSKGKPSKGNENLSEAPQNRDDEAPRLQPVDEVSYFSLFFFFKCMHPTTSNKTDNSAF